jgi:hypothetical protein
MLYKMLHTAFEFSLKMGFIALQMCLTVTIATRGNNEQHHCHSTVCFPLVPLLLLDLVQD